MPSYSFRNTIKLRNGHRIEVEGEEQVVLLATEPTEVDIRPLSAPKFADAAELRVQGGPYPSIEAAIEAGKSWRAILSVAFAKQRLGIDLGPQDDPVAERNAFLAELAAEQGVQALRGRYGLLVFPSEPPAIFGMSSVEVVVPHRPDVLAQLVDEARDSLGDPQLTEAQELALRLLHLSFFDTNPETRFVLLVTAIEAVLDQGERSAKFVQWLEHLISETKASGLDKGTRDAILNYLGMGKRESIGASAKRLVAPLGEQTYDGLSSQAFFTACYTQRSNLVHANLPRTTVHELRSRLPTLERFVIEVLDAEIRGEA
ncbi:hypothetical protein GV792_07765 [Nocardia cyriacigeorgica]|uniref:hypothetical protein n=1 Tax=Nocardia cyriacigeorgica TaxID=135487 RepID=UPI0013B790C3|nr:hypothetical protein [Nocardia cyriacigeorgica]NEW49949.1 hypothetical protein [Nocardia cyriacigeorgica]